MEKEFFDKLEKDARNCASLYEVDDNFRKIIEDVYLLGAANTLNELRDKLEWVDVNERLPNKGGYFLCKTSCRTYQQVLWFDLKNWNVVRDTVTHWRSIDR